MAWHFLRPGELRYCRPWGWSACAALNVFAADPGARAGGGVAGARGPHAYPRARRGQLPQSRRTAHPVVRRLQEMRGPWSLVMPKWASHLCTQKKLCPTPERSAPPPCHLSRLCLVLGKQKRMPGEPVRLSASLHHPPPALPPAAPQPSPIFRNLLPIIPPPPIFPPSTVPLPSIHHHLHRPIVHPPSIPPSHAFLSIHLHHPSSVFPPSIGHLPSTQPCPVFLSCIHPLSIFP